MSRWTTKRTRMEGAQRRNAVVQIMITPALRARLERLAHRERVSVAEIGRRALEGMYGKKAEES